MRKQRSKIFFHSQVYYREDFGDRIASVQVDDEILKSIFKALNHFKGNGLHVRRASELDLSNCFEISCSLLLGVKDMPDILGYGKDNQFRDHCLTEMAKCLIGRSQYTFASLGLAYLHETRAMMTEEKCNKYVKDSVKVRQQFIVSCVGQYSLSSFFIPLFLL